MHLLDADLIYVQLDRTVCFLALLINGQESNSRSNPRSLHYYLKKKTDKHILLIRLVPLLHLAPPLSLRRCQLCFTAVPCDCVYRDGRSRALAGDEGLEEWTRADGAGGYTARGRVLGCTGRDCLFGFLFVCTL